jgi:Na+/H+ antiporter NhaC
MRIKPQTMRIAFWVMLGLTIALISMALNNSSPSAQDATSTTPAQTGTLVATEDVREEAGATDGIMIVAVVIVLIIIIPILLKRQAWSNGKQK